MTEPYFGPPFAHPDRKLIHTFTGHVDQQTEDLAQMISMIRTGWSTERVPKPIGQIVIKLDDDIFISGTLMIESVSQVKDGATQFFLTEWDKQIFRCYVVVITSTNSLNVEVWENPPDTYHIPTPTIHA